jgi:hypothetical protein
MPATSTIELSLKEPHCHPFADRSLKREKAAVGPNHSLRLTKHFSSLQATNYFAA